MSSMRLDRFLSDMTSFSRSDIKKYIRSGDVTVNGIPVYDPSCKVSADSDAVSFRNHEIRYERYLYFMLNKPKGVVSATRDNLHRTCLDLLSEDDRRHDLFPAGRLDIDTEGLLLITNDGPLSHNLLSPSHHVDKTYLALVQGFVDENMVYDFASGFKIDDDFTALPSKLQILSHEDQFTEVSVTIHEGRFHQIKRMFQAFDMKVLSLKRVSMGPLKLDPDLKPGEYRRLTDNEAASLKGIQDE